MTPSPLEENGDFAVIAVTTQVKAVAMVLHWDTYLDK